jgi:hypothetical protein
VTELLLCFMPGDLARLAESISQCFRDASWLIIGCWCLRFCLRFPKPLGDSRSGLEVTSCSWLVRRPLTGSLGGGAGRCLEELVERVGSFSMGGGGGVSGVVKPWTSWRTMCAIRCVRAEPPLKGALRATNGYEYFVFYSWPYPLGDPLVEGPALPPHPLLSG